MSSNPWLKSPVVGSAVMGASLGGSLIYSSGRISSSIETVSSSIYALAAAPAKLVESYKFRLYSTNKVARPERSVVAHTFTAVLRDNKRQVLKAVILEDAEKEACSLGAVLVQSCLVTKLPEAQEYAPADASAP